MYGALRQQNHPETITSKQMTTPSTAHTVSAFRIRRAVDALRQGEVIAYPTEGVWGLGCDPWQESAVMKLLALKQRPVHKGLILIADTVQCFAPLLVGLDPAQQQRLQETWPGPNTWLVPAHGLVPDWITGASDKVALRVSAHPVVQELCRQFGGAIVSTSANRSGLPAATTALAVQLQFPQVLRVPGELTRPGKASTIRDLQTGHLLRP